MFRSRPAGSDDPIPQLSHPTLADRESYEPGRLRYAISLPLPYATVGMVALVGLNHGTGRFAMAAGTALIPLSMISVVLIPLVVVAGVMIIAGTTATRSGWSVEIPASVIAAVGIVAAVVVLLVFQESFEQSTPTGELAGEQTTWFGSVLSWSFLIVALFAATITDQRTVARDGPASRRRSPADPPT